MGLKVPFLICLLVSTNGNLICSEITSFMEREHFTTNMYALLTTSHNKTISLTKNHLVYARKSSMDKFMPVCKFIVVWSV